MLKMAVVQKSYLKNKYPQIHGWVFDVSTGKLIDLNINFREILSPIQEIYNLTGEV